MISFGLACNKTSVEVEVYTTDASTNLTTWEISMAHGTVVASHDPEQDEEGKICIPVDACGFTVFDHSEADSGPTFETLRLGEVYQTNGGALGVNMMTTVDIFA